MFQTARAKRLGRLWRLRSSLRPGEKQVPRHVLGAVAPAKRLGMTNVMAVEGGQSDFEIYRENLVFADLFGAGARQGRYSRALPVRGDGTAVRGVSGRR